jgi:diguanylate cyclase
MFAKADRRSQPVKRFSLRALWQRFRVAPRVRIMTYALAASLLCGVTGFLEPLDDFVRGLRYSLQYEQADGSIVVVGMDQRSIQALGGKYPWTPNYDARLIENLKKAGVGRIVFDRSFSDVDTAATDSQLITVLDRYRGDVFFGVGAQNTKNGLAQSRLFPADVYLPHVELASYNQMTNPIGQLAKLSTRIVYEGKIYPSLSATLAGLRGEHKETWYRPNFAIRAESFRTVSAVDVVQGRADPTVLRGRDVIVGLTEMSFGDSHFLPGQGRVQGVYAHAIGGQTLRAGTPLDIGWIPPLLIAAISAIALLKTRRAAWNAAITAWAITVLALAPMVLDQFLISSDIAPAVLLFGIVLVQYARLRLGWVKSRMHEGSGLPNVTALREVQARSNQALFVARIDNHAAITASFAKDVEPLIAREIVARLKVGDATTAVYQGEEGVYYWLSPITDPALLSEHLDGLHALFSQPVAIQDRHVDVSVTFGVDNDPKRVMSSRIGSALLSAEDARRAGLRWKIYDDSRNADAAWQLSLGSEIDRGLRAGEFWLAYQPKLDLRTNRMVGAEALVRWAHPQRGAIGPIDFIPAAERDHRIESLTRFVFRQAMSDAVALKGVSSITLALNVSAPVLRRPDFSTFAIELADQYGLSASMFTIEITESVFLSVEDECVGTNLKRLRDAGFGISIDDFGTGFSTFESLQRVPATEVKIDQTFVKSLSNRSADRIIVTSIIKMAQGLNRKVVAEGVEDAQTLRQLAALGCDEVQGYFVGRPQPFADFVELLSTNKVRTAA